jgi:hypothetical protein
VNETEDEYIALACVEMPEVRFEDVIVLWLNQTHLKENDVYELRQKLDPRYVDVCEPGSISVTSIVPSIFADVAADIVNDELVMLVRTQHVPLKLTVSVSGLRVGHTWRFRQHTKADAEANQRFWSAWRQS